ncbi:DUF1657 domain-containing protein [Oceanobacillus polygoni]
MELFALSTENPESKEMYQRNSKKLQSAIATISSYLN